MKDLALPDAYIHEPSEGIRIKRHDIEKRTVICLSEVQHLDDAFRGGAVAELYFVLKSLQFIARGFCAVYRFAGPALVVRVVDFKHGSRPSATYLPNYGIVVKCAPEHHGATAFRGHRQSLYAFPLGRPPTESNPN